MTATNTAMIPADLANYAKSIVRERGISQAEMTKEIMGDILKEAMRRIDRAVTRYIESPDAQSAFKMSIYLNTPITR